MSWKASVAVLAVGLLASACVPSERRPACKRFEGLALTPENHFAGSIDLEELGTIDSQPEQMYLVMFLAGPVRGAVDLIHVVGDKELERWRLNLPTSGGTVARCTIGLRAASSPCSATISAVPHPIGGYYYLMSDGNTVLEAGLSFYLCD